MAVVNASAQDPTDLSYSFAGAERRRRRIHTDQSQGDKTPNFGNRFFTDLFGDKTVYKVDAEI